MKKKIAGWGAAVVLAVGGLYGLNTFVGRPEKSPGDSLREAADRAEFRHDWDVRGDDDGAGCHMISRVLKDGTIQPWYQHMIPGKDFRRGGLEERKGWIIEDIKRDIGEIGIACGAPDPFFRPAYAPPYCEDCGGGGCAAYNCPATTHAIGPCTVNGSTCTMTFFCCNWPCQNWPPC